MLQVRQGFEGLVRLDKKLKVTDPVTEIKTGACCKLDSNGEVVKTGSDASAEDLVLFAFTSANVADEINTAFKTTGKITLLAPTGYLGETDQYLKNNAVTGTVAETFAITANSNDKLKIRVDGGAPQTFTLTAGGTRSAANIVTDLAGLTGATASVATDKVKITSDSASGFIEFEYVANSANATLGLSLGASAVGADLASENGLLIPAATNDRVVAQSFGTDGDGVLKYLATAKGAVA